MYLSGLRCPHELVTTYVTSAAGWEAMRSSASTSLRIGTSLGNMFVREGACDVARRTTRTRAGRPGELFRLVGVLDAAELALRRLGGDVRAARKAVETAGELAAAVERDSAEGQAAFRRLEQLKRGDDGPADRGGAGPVSLPFRPGPSTP